MSCYKCDRKHPYRAEILFRLGKSTKLLEVASRTKQELDEQVEKLIERQKEEEKLSTINVEIKLFHQEQLLSTEEKSKSA